MTRVKILAGSHASSLTSYCVRIHEGFAGTSCEVEVGGLSGRRP